MSYIAYMIGLALLSWAILPLFKKDSTWISVYWKTEELEEHKKRVYGNIADLEFDYAMGRLSDKDFANVRQSFLSEAGRVIEKLEQEKASDLSARIRQDANKLGKHKTKKNKMNFCPDCGSKNLTEAKFCMNCGRKLS